MGRTFEFSETDDIIKLIRHHIQEKDFEKASHELVASFEKLVNEGCWRAIRSVLDTFPLSFILENTNLMYIQGRVRMREELPGQARYWFEKAKLIFSNRNDIASEADSCFYLARIYQLMEDFKTASSYIDDATNLLQNNPLANQYLNAKLHFSMANLCPDIGQIQKGRELAEKALKLFIDIGAIREQFETLMLMSLIARQMGYYQEATSRLERAKQLYFALSPDEQSYVWILNTEAHIEWYKGELAKALECGNEANERADKLVMVNRKWQARTRLALGNIHRALGDYVTARNLYNQSRKITTQSKDSFFLPWIDAHIAWLELLEGNFDNARRILYSTLDSRDVGREMSINVFVAVLDILESRFDDAEHLLLRSLKFYLESGDWLSVCVIRSHLAYILLKTGRVQEAQSYLVEVLQWIEEWSIDYFPHWWHPKIVSGVFAHALELNLYPHTVERIFINHLRGDGAVALRPILNHASETARKRAGHLLEVIGEVPYAGLDRVKDPRIREALKDLLETGQLRPDSYERLMNKLKTASHRDIANPVAVAIFGLYIHGKSRREIARILGRSEKTVGNSITVIYDLFNLAQDFVTREERKQKLRELAQQEGFV